MNFVIGKKATIENATALHEEISKWFAMDDNDLTIDLSSAETIDFSFIQLLVFLGNRASLMKKTINIKNNINEALFAQLKEMYLLYDNTTPQEALNGLLNIGEII